jgi:methyl-accepting chemotaxis protein
MSQVDTVTQRNASAAEELSSTSEEMASQSQQLQQMMTFFRARGEEPASPPAGRKQNAPPAGKSIPVVQFKPAFPANGAHPEERDFTRF